MGVVKKKAVWPARHVFIDLASDRSQVAMERGNGGAGTDNATEQLRAERYDEQARGRGAGKGHDGVCPYRSCRGGESGWAIATPDRGVGLPQCQSWHATGAVALDRPHRPAAHGAGLTRE